MQPVDCEEAEVEMQPVDCEEGVGEEEATRPREAEDEEAQAVVEAEEDEADESMQSRAAGEVLHGDGVEPSSRGWQGDSADAGGCADVQRPVEQLATDALAGDSEEAGVEVQPVDCEEGVGEQKGTRPLEAEDEAEED